MSIRTRMIGLVEGGPKKPSLANVAEAKKLVASMLADAMKLMKYAEMGGVFGMVPGDDPDDDDDSEFRCGKVIEQLQILQKKL